MGNICPANDFKNTRNISPQSLTLTNKLVQEVELDKKSITIQLYRGYCAIDKSDVIVNISDEYISGSSNEQEIMLFSIAGEELRKETIDYIQKHKHLHHKLPFYTHAGDVSISNVIHCTLNENKQTISENQIQQTLIECLQIADEELEASSISFPMIYLRNYSLKKISKIMINSINLYIKKTKRNINQHLQVIKIIGNDLQQLTAYMKTNKDIYQDMVKTFANHEQASIKKPAIKKVEINSNHMYQVLKKEILFLSIIRKLKKYILMIDRYRNQ